MTPAQLQQALTIRTLRAEKAERALKAARDTERRAREAVDDANDQLAAFDRAIDARITAFYAKASTGIAPESLHSAKAFHADLTAQRADLVDLIAQAEAILSDAKARCEHLRIEWLAADAAARKLHEIRQIALKQDRRDHERYAEQDADDLFVARAYRTTE